MSNRQKNRVLFLSPQGNHRDQISKSLQMMSYKVDFVSALSEVYAAIDAFKSSVFVHEWRATDPTQARKFHRQWKSSCDDVIRITVHDKINPSALAFASDAHIDKVVSSGDAVIGLAGAIDMIRANQTSGELDALLKEIDRGHAEYKQEDIDGLVEESFKKFSHNSQVKIEFGGLCLRRDETKQAKEQVAEVLSKEPSNLRATHLLSRIHMKEGNWDDAQKVLLNANKLSPGNPDRLISIGDAFLGGGDIDKAMGYYEEAVDAANDIGESASEAGQKVASIRLERGEVEEAIALLQKSASEDEIASYFNNGAIMATRNEKFDEAVKLYDLAIKALKSDRLKPIIYTNMAISLKRLNRIDDAKKAIKRALRINPKHEKAQLQEKKLSKM